MRIAESERPDLLARALDGHERIVARNAVATVLAERAGLDVLSEVRDDSKNLSGHRVEALRIETNAGPLVARPSVAACEIEHTPIRISAPRDRIENEIADGMDPAVQPNAEQLSRGAFKR